MRVCLMLPAHARDAAALVSAIIRQHSDVELLAVWGGAPDQRPAADRWRWIDLDLPDADEVGWGRLLLAVPPRAYEWARTAAAVAALPADGSIVVVRAGDVIVTGPLDPLAQPDEPIVVCSRGADDAPTDGLAPDRHDRRTAGRWSTAVALLRPGVVEVRSITDELVTCHRDADVGATFERAVARTGFAEAPEGVAEVVGWGTPGTTVPAVLDVASVEVDPGRSVLFGGRPPRWPLSGAPALVEKLASEQAQATIGRHALELPGGLTVDASMRSLVVDAIVQWRRGDGALPPDPVGATEAFHDWLVEPWPPWGPDIGRYWMAIHAGRSDLQHAFPDPGGADAGGFRAWTAERHRHEPEAPAIRPAERSLRPEWHDVDRRPGGINLIGYLGFDKSLGDVARRVLAALEAAGVPVAALDYHRSGSPRTADAPSLGHDLVYDTNLLIINADQQANIAADYGPILYPGRRTIAYWFWDVAHVPPPMMPAFDLVDEVWVASDFTAEALRAASDTPVRTMPIPVPCPDRSAATRADLGLPEGRFVFLVTFDHLSVTERKNPLGAIEAFRRAFPESNPDGPVLVVKSINASHRPAEHDWVLQAAAGRDDVIVVDRHLSRGDQMSLVAESDCVVSLHRTEGLGLHLVEAMWFGRPTIATRYSGNLAFMSDDNSALIDAALVPVTHGEGYFPPEAVWAEPDLDQAASWMQRIVGDPELAARLGSAGRTTMEAQPNMQDTGQAIAAHAAEVPIASADDAAGTAGIAVKRSLVDKARGRAGWLLRGGANERQALDEHAAALRDLQVVVAGLEQRIQQLEGAPRTTDGALDVAEIGRRVTQLSDVVAALSIDRRDDEDRDRER